MILASLLFAFLAAALHVYIFTMESFTWTRPATWKRFGLASQADAETTKPLAYNQGFYNLFLAIGAFIGAGLVAAGASGSPLRPRGRMDPDLQLLRLHAAGSRGARAERAEVPPPCGPARYNAVARRRSGRSGGDGGLSRAANFWPTQGPGRTIESTTSSAVCRGCA